MHLTVTQAGITAADKAQTGGPSINITTFKVGSSYNYTPTGGETQLYGTVLYSGSVLSYAVVSSDTVSYTLLMNETVGDFAFGELGLYLSDGTLFAIGSLSALRTKLRSTGNAVGNIIQITAKMTLSNIAAVIDFPIQNLTNARILELDSVDHLVAPLIAGGNAYICHDLDDGGNNILAYRHSDTQWDFTTHQVMSYSGYASSGSTTQMLESSNIGAMSVVSGKYLIKFTSGQNGGLVRLVTAGGNGSVSWNTPLQTAPVTGDAFEIYRSTHSLSTDLSTYTTMFVEKGGDTMTGELELYGNPIQPLGAAPRQYVDAAVAPKADKSYVDSQDALKVNKAGDTMGGFLTANADPTQPLHYATKQYVDNHGGATSDELYWFETQYYSYYAKTSTGQAFLNDGRVARGNWSNLYCQSGSKTTGGEYGGTTYYYSQMKPMIYVNNRTSYPITLHVNFTGRIYTDDDCWIRLLANGTQVWAYESGGHSYMADMYPQCVIDINVPANSTMTVVVQGFIGSGTDGNGVDSVYLWTENDFHLVYKGNNYGLNAVAPY